jgi:hypothetical protein
MQRCSPARHQTFSVSSRQLRRASHCHSPSKSARNIRDHCFGLLCFGYLRIAQWLDLGFPLRLALGFERRDVARMICTCDGWDPPNNEYRSDGQHRVIAGIDPQQSWTTGRFSCPNSRR